MAESISRLYSEFIGSLDSLEIFDARLRNLVESEDTDENDNLNAAVAYIKDAVECMNEAKKFMGSAISEWMLNNDKVPVVLEMYKNLDTEQRKTFLMQLKAGAENPPLQA